MIARVVLALFALMGFVNAEVPQFSATDDYDELNLNIRMLKSHNATTSGNETEKVITVDVTFTLPSTPDDDMKAKLAGGFAYALMIPADAVEVTNVVEARRLSEKSRKLAAADYVITFKVTLPAAMAQGKVDAIKNTAQLMEDLKNVFATGDFAIADLVVKSIAEPTVADKGEAPAPESPAADDDATPAASTTPAAAPASNAAMMSANIVLVAVAALSSFF